MGLAPPLIAAQTALTLLFVAGILGVAPFVALIGLSLLVLLVGRSR
jgi:hypothetical protein